MNNQTNHFTFASLLPIACFLAYHSFLYTPQVNSVCLVSVWSRDSDPNSCCADTYDGIQHIERTFCKLMEEKQFLCFLKASKADHPRHKQGQKTGGTQIPYYATKKCKFN